MQNEKRVRYLLLQSKIKERSTKHILPYVARALWLLSAGPLASNDASAEAQPTLTCDSRGIGSVDISAAENAFIESVSTGRARDNGLVVPYCLVRVHVPQKINIWVGLPMNGLWNGRLQSEGGGGYGGVIGVPIYSITQGYVGVQTDTGHSYEAGNSGSAGGAFAMLAPGVPNILAQEDFAYRSQHLMALVGKKLAQAFYGMPPRYAYWNGCSEGGREGLRMAQDFPGDYDGILAGAPAINWDRAAAYEIWPQLAMKLLAGGRISGAKLKLATQAAIGACDAMDGVSDGIITDPRRCQYWASRDEHLTDSSCTSLDDTCLSPQEASAIDSMWRGATNKAGTVLWPGVERGAPLDFLGGIEPSGYAIDQARYWVYLNPMWNWQSLTFETYEEFFQKSVEMVNRTLSTNKGDLSAFRARGGKLLMWHGLNDGLIVPRSSIAYYENVANSSHLERKEVPNFLRLFLAPGVEHCGGGAAPQPGRQRSDESWLAIQQAPFDALVSWVERGRAPDRITTSQLLESGRIRTRPLCSYPSFAQYTHRGSADDESNFECSEHISYPNNTAAR